jgi:hypothetical protein
MLPLLERPKYAEHFILDHPTVHILLILTKGKQKLKKGMRPEDIAKSVME